MNPGPTARLFPLASVPLNPTRLEPPSEPSESYLLLLHPPLLGFGQWLAADWHLLLLSVVLLALSGMISGYEAAFFSLKPEDRDQLTHGQGRFARSLRRLLEQPQQLLATILIANNLVNVALIILSTYLMSDLHQEYTSYNLLWTLLDVVVVTGLLLLFGEITPKVYANQYRGRYLHMFTPLIRLLFRVFYPLSWGMAQTSRALFQPPGREASEASAEDLRHAIALADETDSPQDEKAILRALVNLEHIPVRSIMRARVDIQALDQTATLEEVLAFVREKGYSRVPVYNENLDNMVGILYVKDLLRHLDEQPGIRWQSIVRPTYFVPENKRLSRLLNEFKAKRLHIAVVVDEYGGTSGLITLQDILEEIFGEMADEGDPEGEPPYIKISENEYVFDGKTLLLDVCKAAELPESAFTEAKGEHDSLAGLVLELNGRFPEVGEEIRYDSYRFVVEEVTDRLVKRIRLIIETPEAETAQA